jgi:phosphate transport system protein
MADNHIVKSFDREMARLKDGIVQMGNGCLEQVSAAIEALRKRDGRLAEKIVAEDKNVNELQTRIEGMTIQLLALRQPVAKDLRVIVASLKIASDLERFANYAANIAKNMRELDSVALEGAVQTILDMAGHASSMLQDVMEAYRDADPLKSVEVWRRDAEINRRYEELIGHLRAFMGEKCENVQAPTALMFMGRCCERMGDHIKNVAEHIFYIATGCMYITDKEAAC